MSAMTPEDIIDWLFLKLHPERGLFREKSCAAGEVGGRGALTGIYYSLKANERLRWHRIVDADAIWNCQVGAPMLLTLAGGAEDVEQIVLRLDLLVRDRSQVAVPKGNWQPTWPQGDYTQIGCKVVPARFEGFGLAHGDWTADYGR